MPRINVVVHHHQHEGFVTDGQNVVKPVVHKCLVHLFAVIPDMIGNKNGSKPVYECNIVSCVLRAPIKNCSILPGTNPSERICLPA